MRDPEYRSAFRSWDARAWVRAKPRRTAPYEPGRLLFTPDVVPLVGCRDLPADVVEDLCARHLQWHLAMTVRLETGPVNDAVAVIRDSEWSAVFPRELRHDALRLYTDEAGHAEMTNAMAYDVERATGVPAPANPPPFVRRVRAAVDTAPDELRDLVRLVAAFVSETLITSTLTRVPYDDRVQLAVRELVADHADDERRHAVFFRDVFVRVWPRLDEETRRYVGTAVPDLIAAFLEPDEDELHAAAGRHAAVLGDPAAAAKAAVAAATDGGSIRAGAEATVRILNELGALDDPAVASAFVGRGLSPDVGGVSRGTRAAPAARTAG